MMFTVGGKTAVSILQEYVVSKDTIASYELTKNENQGTHNPEFTVRVKVESQWAEGTGRSKQEAKQRAAEKMIKQLKIVDAESENQDDSFSEIFTSKENYVGLLKDYCLMHLYPEPNYYVEEEAGPPHSKVFKMSCRVSQLQDFGISKTKKLAKQEAACKMFERLKKLTRENEIGDADCNISKFIGPKTIHKIPEFNATDEEVIEKYKAARLYNNPSAKDPAVFYKDQYRAYEGLEETSPSLVKLMNMTDFDEEDSLNYIKEIAKELEVNVRSIEVPSCEDEDAKFVVMTMSVVPSISGIGTDDQSAAHNLLESLLSLLK